MHLEIDEVRIHGKVSMCESRPGAMDLPGYVSVEGLVGQAPPGGVTPPASGPASSRPNLPPGSSLTGPGTFVLCNDGSTSHAGGKRGACSYHGGVR